MILTKLFVEIDDFMKKFEKELKKRLIEDGSVKRDRETKLSNSEIMTILVYFHISGYRTFKSYYINYVRVHLKNAFPDLVSYKRFVALQARVLLPLAVFMKNKRAKCSGISFIDSTPISVCHNRRIHSHRVFEGIAKLL